MYIKINFKYVSYTPFSMGVFQLLSECRTVPTLSLCGTIAVPVERC